MGFKNIYKFKHYLSRVSSDSLFSLAVRAKRKFLNRLRGFLLKCSKSFNGRIGRLNVGENLVLSGGKNVYFNGDVKIGDNCRIEIFSLSGIQPRLSIGADVNIGNNVHIGVTGNVKIGNGSLLGSNILIIDHNHGNPAGDVTKQTGVIPKKRPLVNTGDISIGRNVWICDSVVILGGVVIGEGAIIPAGSIVKDDVKSYTIFGRV